MALEAGGICTIGALADVARTRVEVVPDILGDTLMASELAVAASLRLAWQVAPFSVTKRGA